MDKENRNSIIDYKCIDEIVNDDLKFISIKEPSRLWYIFNW